MIFNYNEEEQRVEKGISLKKGLSYNKSLILGFIVLINVSIYLLIYWSLKDLTEDNS